MSLFSAVTLLYIKQNMILLVVDGPVQNSFRKDVGIDVTAGVIVPSNFVVEFLENNLHVELLWNKRIIAYDHPLSGRRGDADFVHGVEAFLNKFVQCRLLFLVFFELHDRARMEPG